jgi:hypothetical protein
MPLYKYRPSSSFASSSKRDCYIPPSNKPPQEEDEISDDEQAPGPGYYSLGASVTAFSAKSVPERLQFFGSTVSRFKPVRPETANIGPGMYGELRKPIAAKKPGDSKAPFSSTKTRFQANVDSSSPGPGAYKGETLVDSVNKKVWGKQGVFGSSEQRFVEKTESQLGPGYYPPDADKRIGSHNSASRKQGSAFLSKVKRQACTKNTDTPAPGTYEVNIKPKSKPNPGSPFKASHARFKEAKSEAVGPGSYTPQDQSKPAFAAKGFIAREPRFKSKHEEEKPGPGAYLEERGTEWTKPSFNVLFTELS